MPDIFKDSMESDIFTQILTILNETFVSKNDNVFDYLESLSKVKRFRTLVLFMSSSDKKGN